MEVQVVMVDTLALVDEQAERDVERLLAGAADPEEAVALLVHGDEALLEGARPQHQVVDLEAQLGGEPAGRAADGGLDHAHGRASVLPQSGTEAQADGADLADLGSHVSKCVSPQMLPRRGRSR
jgi:hypothetical protein